MIEAMLQPSEIAPERVRPLRRTEYELMVVAGAFEGERLEFLSGALVEMTPPTFGFEVRSGSPLERASSAGI